ncbi:NDR1/HIN1-like protein 13 [Diospyros lotus]|uniref:NDR1/HIN1-like protein 13 n=1 Tax=Diospyros lotus TaxID=55363 RepID=UPI0022534135|nr:NDR1/HIN1-like protein 13 [Diospyros lotus]
MADRVHPTSSPPRSADASQLPPKPDHPGSESPVPPPATYVIQVPKDQIYRHPPPENARRMKNYSRRNPRRSCCCRCLCWTLGLLALFLVLLAATAGILYLVFRPESPKYSVEDVAVRGFNLSSASTVSPKFDVTIRARNPNNKIGIYYEKESSVEVYYSDVRLCNGALPAFYQPSNNLTVLVTNLEGSNVILSSGVHSALVNDQEKGKVPLRVRVKAPVKLKIGAVKTWTITVKVKCDVAVDSLTTSSKILSKDCDYSVKLWD